VERPSIALQHHRDARLKFSNLPSVPKRRCRKYFLEHQDGQPVFRLAEMPSKPTLPRDEIEVVFDEVMLELFGPDPDGNEIVPQKLAKLFPGSLKTPRS
jgi:hypothetical protein